MLEELKNLYSAEESQQFTTMISDIFYSGNDSHEHLSPLFH